MISIFTLPYLSPPYDNVTFPGKGEEERILYATRESPIILGSRLVIFSIATCTFLLAGALVLSWAGTNLEFDIMPLLLLLMVLSALILLGGFWWIWQVFQKTVFIITTHRLTKFIHTTPWNRYQMSLTLDKVVDSGTYAKGYLQAIFGLGTFVARSSAGNIKNFKIVNIHFAEDLHNWMNKLLFVFNKESIKLEGFRPFIPKPVGKRY